jgi:VacB/RNase II family 3'-5' exoribonuclease
VSTGPRASGRLHALAREALRDRGFEPDFPPDVQREVDALKMLRPAVAPRQGVRDLRQLPWSAIDNADTRDVDQVEVAERTEDGSVRVLIGIADVEWLVPRNSAIDRRAATNTTSVYTAAGVFPMLPDVLSTGYTSFVEGEDRLAVVIELVVGGDGEVRSSDVYRAVVRNQAQLDYDSVGAWLDGGAAPPKVARSPELQAQLRLQDEAAQALRGTRFRRGALRFENQEARAVVRGGKVVDLRVPVKTRAGELVEDFMITANVAMAEFCERHGVSRIARVVQQPRRWDRIADIARLLGDALPEQPDTAALAAFLERRRAAGPTRFQDLSVSVVKLVGGGGYLLDTPGPDAPDHFALALTDYSHSTAPNRRYADLVLQRQVKAVLAGLGAAYADGALAEIARRCTLMEDEAARVERLTRKQAAALLLAGRAGERFDAVVTGAKPDATYARIHHPAVEGRIIRGERGLDVGDPVRVRLNNVDVEKGFIDFERD